jgi:hypothetical protein
MADLQRHGLGSNVVNLVDNTNIFYHAESAEIAEREENKGNYYTDPSANFAYSA